MCCIVVTLDTGAFWNGVVSVSIVQQCLVTVSLLHYAQWVHSIPSWIPCPFNYRKYEHKVKSCSATIWDVNFSVTLAAKLFNISLMISCLTFGSFWICPPVVLQNWAAERTDCQGFLLGKEGNRNRFESFFIYFETLTNFKCSQQEVKWGLKISYSSLLFNWFWSFDIFDGLGSKIQSCQQLQPRVFSFLFIYLCFNNVLFLHILNLGILSNP